LADLLSRATSERGDNNQARVTRDKAYTLLKQALDEIRECGQYVFWRNPQRLKGYVSQYHKRWKKSNKNDSLEVENQTS
jgi:hypothetical protein